MVHSLIGLLVLNKVYLPQLFHIHHAKYNLDYYFLQYSIGTASVMSQRTLYAFVIQYILTSLQVHKTEILIPIQKYLNHCTNISSGKNTIQL